MDDIMSTAALRRRGLDDRELLRLQRRGELTRIRRGAYAASPAEPLSAADQHGQLIRATVPQLGPGAVISHGSAAVLRGLPFWPDAVNRVHITRNRSTGAKRRSLVEVHGAALEPEALTGIEGVTVTSLSRTVLDLGRRCRTSRLSPPAIEPSRSAWTARTWRRRPTAWITGEASGRRGA